MKYYSLDTKQHSIYRFCFKKCTCLRRDTSTHCVPFFIYRHVCCMPHRTCKTLCQRRCMPRCWLTKTPVYTPSERWKPVSVYLNFIGTIYWYGVTVFLKVLRNKRTTDVESTFLHLSSWQKTIYNIWWSFSLFQEKYEEEALTPIS